YFAADRPSVFVFGHEAGENPALRAVQAAEAACRQLVDRAVVDLALVTIGARPGGKRRYRSAAFSDAGRFPRPEDPPGVIATQSVAEALGRLVTCEPLQGRPGTVRVRLAAATTEEVLTIGALAGEGIV